MDRYVKGLLALIGLGTTTSCATLQQPVYPIYPPQYYNIYYMPPPPRTPTYFTPAPCNGCKPNGGKMLDIKPNFEPRLKKIDANNTKTYNGHRKQ